MNMIEKRMQMRGQGGFTLIELLVAVAILAILAGVAVFAVGTLRDDANTSACKTERQTIKTANEAANATNLTTDTYADFIEGTPKYFDVTSGGSDNSRTVSLEGIGANEDNQIC
jgi:prepilin-type N-terminal cleavage/methylation domain-containing protein